MLLLNEVSSLEEVFHSKDSLESTLTVQVVVMLESLFVQVAAFVKEHLNVADQGVLLTSELRLFHGLWSVSPRDEE